MPEHPLAAVFAILAAYVCGSIPFGLLVGRMRGVDLRTEGSRNIGATNAGRVLGMKWGVLVLVLDALKGLAGTALLPTLAGVETGQGHLQVLCGMAAILGHMYPLWLGFRGGKGVATSLGVIVVLAPLGTGVAFAAFVLTFAITRIVSLSSMVAAAALAAAQLILLQPNPFSEETWSLTGFSIAIPLLVVFRHRDNIRRLLRGEEKPFSSHRPLPDPVADDAVPEQTVR